MDSLSAQEGTARDQRIDHGAIVERRLNDGRVFRIVKVFYETEPLASRLRRLGWTALVRATPSFFIHGTASPGER